MDILLMQVGVGQYLSMSSVSPYIFVVVKMLSISFSKIEKEEKICIIISAQNQRVQTQRNSCSGLTLEPSSDLGSKVLYCCTIDQLAGLKDD